MNVRERLFAFAEHAGTDDARALRGLLIHAQKGNQSAIEEVAKTIGATPDEIKSLGVEAMEELRGRLRVQAAVVQKNEIAAVGATTRSHTLNKGIDPKLVNGLAQVVGADNVTTNVGNAADNTLGIKRTIAGIVKPQNADEISAVLKLARAAGQAVHVISRGQNCGYGNKAPVKDGALLIDLSRMTNISGYDEKRGVVVVEPGVTQEQLCKFLEEKQSPFMMDVTGAGKKSSLVGNVLDGGYGWSPIGDRKKHLAKLDAVLPDGTKFSTSDPNEARKFVQSGLGIVTKIEFPLLKRPERIEAYVIRVDDPSQIGEATRRLAALGITGTFGGVPHLSNAAKTRRSTGGGGSDESWTIVGGLYGSRDELRKIKDEMKVAMRGIGKVKAYNSTTVNLVEKTAKLASFLPVARELHTKVMGLKELFSILEGKPTDAFVARAVAGDDTGLMWVSQRIKPGSKEMDDAIQIAERVCAKYGEEAPITIAMLDDGDAALLLGVHFDKNDKEETKRAQSLYGEVLRAMKDAGIKPYRMTVAGQESMPPDAALVDEKKARDPMNLFQPGRYGLGGAPGVTAPLIQIEVGPQKKITAGDAANDDEIRAGMALLKDRYADKGYVSRDGTITLPEGARVMVARREEQVVGTISLIPDGKDKLPADKIFAAEIEALRKQGRRVVEIGKFAVSDELSKMEAPKASRALFRAVERAVKEGAGCDDIVITVNPNHVEYYRKAMGFHIIGGPKALDAVGGAPAVLLKLPVGVEDRVP